MGEEIARQRMDEQKPHKRNQQCRAGNVGDRSGADVNQIVAIDRSDEADRSDGDDCRRLAERWHDEVQRLPPGDEGRTAVSDVHERNQDHDKGSAFGAELAAALDHLRHTQAGTLSRMQRHEDRANQIANQDGDNGGPEGLMEEGSRERTGHYGEYVKVRAEPEREQLMRLTVPLIERNLIDRVLLDARRFFGAASQRSAHRFSLLPRQAWTIDSNTRAGT